MAKIPGTFQTFQSVGNREELSDRIYNISPEDTPGMSNGGRETVDSTYFEWQIDTLAAPDAANAQIQGDDVTTFATVVPTTRLGNRTQISSKTLIVSRTQERVRKAGRKSEVAYQLAKLSAELKRDMETIMFGTNQAQLAGGTATASLTGSILSFIATNDSFGAGGASPAGANGTAARTDGTQRNYTEVLLKVVLSSIWTEGGKPELVMTGAANKQNSSTFTGVAQLRKAVEGAKQATIIGAADQYVGDFGIVSFVPNRFMRARDALVLDPSMYAVAYLDPFKVENLAKTGDTAAKKLLVVEYGLKVHNEKAHGGVFDLNTAVL
jgi:hypothetical protein